MADDRIEVEIVLDDGSIQKGFAKIRNESKKSASAMQKAFSRATNRGFSKPLDTIKNSVFSLRTALLSAVAVVGGGAFIGTITRAAAQQQEAVNALNTSLKTAGTFSKEASDSFQELASSLQANSRFGDEVILQQAALARNFARTNEEAERLVTAAVDLSEATGISLDSAVRNLGKTFSGLQGELGESIPQLRSLTAEQLKAGAAIDLIQQRFGGSALAATRTFNGALTQLQNTFGDLLEGLGSTIANSPQVIAFFNALSQTFNNITQQLSGSGASFDSFFKDLVINSASAINAIIDSFEVVSQIPDFFRFAFLKAKLETMNFVQSFLLTIEPVSGFIDRIFGDAGASARNISQNFKAIGEVEAQLEALADSSIKGGEGFNFARKAVEDFTTTFQELSVATAPGAGGAEVASPAAPLVQAVDQDLLKLREKVAMLQMETKAAINGAFFNNEDVLAGTPSVFENLADKSTSALMKLQSQLTSTRDKAVQLSAQVGQAVNNGIANTISNGVASVVKALQSGEDAFGAFAKAALATIGDLAVQLGQTLIASGIGIEALKVLGGAAAIAAGIALVAVGTLIKGAAGGGSPNPSGGSSVTPPLADLEPDGVSDNLGGAQQNINVRLEGNLIDPEGAALAMADLFKEQGFNNAVVS